MPSRLTRPNTFKFVLLAVAGLISWLPMSSAYALSTDRDQPADIEADDIEFNMRNGTRTFTNNVIAVQGTLRIKADKLVAKYENGELANVDATGSLARFKQRPDNKPNDVEGWAKKIVVDQKKNLLTLTGQAALRQGGDTARGNVIVYDMARDTLKVQGGAAVGYTNNTDSTKKADPNRKIEDPFKDELPTAPAAPDSAISATQKANADGEQPKATSSGRSRLIIQPKPSAKPKPKKGKKDKSEKDEKDSSENDEKDKSDQDDADGSEKSEKESSSDE
ncbi:MAG: lipopolysaccharide transport periplasmic protein LptA [Pseudomonadota bacterium]